MSNPLIAYFSAGGTTAAAAKKLAEAVQGELYEIRPAVPYTRADLNWMNRKSRSSVEMKDKASRPELADRAAPVGAHDVIFLGFPIWWYVAPTIINTFLEAYDFSGKRIILFATSGGSRFGTAADGLRPSVAADTQIVEGRMMNGRISEEELKNWAHSVL